MTDGPTYDDGTVRLPDAIERWLDGHFAGEKDDDGDLLMEWQNVTAVAFWSLIYRRGDEEDDQAAIDAFVDEAERSGPVLFEGTQRELYERLLGAHEPLRAHWPDRVRVVAIDQETDQ